MRVKPVLVTWTLVLAVAFFGLAAALYPLLRSPVLPGVRTTASVVTSESRSLSAIELASMKSAVLDYDAQHRQADTTAAVQQPPPPKPAVVQASQPPATPPPAAPPAYHASAGDYSYSGLEQIWEANGGSAQTAATAACIAEHESTGNTDAISPTSDVGLWQINVSHDPGLSWDAWVADMENPSNNAHEAITLSDGGSTWSQWTTAGDCGV
jgi:hypothetical protein